MPAVRIDNIETIEELKKFRDVLSEKLGIKLTLGETIAWILKHGPRPEDYFPKPALEMKK